MDAWTLNPDRPEHIAIAGRLIAAGIDRIPANDTLAMAAALDNAVVF